jgi:hypothetical protein
MITRALAAVALATITFTILIPAFGGIWGKLL